MSRRRRLLLRTDILAKAIELYDIGVPGARIKKNLDLTCTTTHLLRLIRQTKVNPTALIPPWIDHTGPIEQSQPDNYRFDGFFPHGNWERR